MIDLKEALDTAPQAALSWPRSRRRGGGDEPHWKEGGGIIAGNHHVYRALTEIL